MKTSHNTIKTGNRSRVRSLLAIAGVVTAILGSLVFLHDFYGNAPIKVSVPRAMATSKIINTDMLIQVTSTIWSFK
ncbi:hypothetical protein [Chryseolinea soli]|uniref:Uncharacterized protein n=1 Tax=Chryseolinea soli TaxID=2321403 RepID=A0A385SPB3_9BACT|nr:hypothetical protein [Chryseolinea soli]AYB32682.1 hypothetical protein D4L85_19805 [Chryseolinea soli]